MSEQPYVSEQTKRLQVRFDAMMDQNHRSKVAEQLELSRRVDETGSAIDANRECADIGYSRLVKRIAALESQSMFNSGKVVEFHNRIDALESAQSQTQSAGVSEKPADDRALTVGDLVEPIPDVCGDVPFLLEEDWPQQITKANHGHVQVGNCWLFAHRFRRVSPAIIAPADEPASAICGCCGAPSPATCDHCVPPVGDDVVVKSAADDAAMRERAEAWLRQHGTPCSPLAIIREMAAFAAHELARKEGR